MNERAEADLRYVERLRADLEAATRLAAERGAALARAHDLLRAALPFIAAGHQSGDIDTLRCPGCKARIAVEQEINNPTTTAALDEHARVMAVVEAARKAIDGRLTTLRHARGSQAEHDLHKAIRDLDAYRSAKPGGAG